MQIEQLDTLKVNHATLLPTYGKPLLDGVYLKSCAKCCCVKPTTEFHRCAKSRDGIAYECKVCTNAAKTSRVVHLADVPKDFSHPCRKCHTDTHVNDISYMEVSRKGFTVVCKACKYTERRNAIANRSMSDRVAVVRRESLRIAVILGYETMPLIPLKECNACIPGHRYHPITAFAGNHTTADGLSCYCRKCMAGYRIP